MTRNIGTFSSLSKNQKEATCLLSIGTFLEYFDLMLYVHMAILLNELFFPKTDPDTAALVQAFSFCTTFIFRPIGAWMFGWIGDHVGRKSIVIVTTVMMALSCVAMANLPTYAQIGIAASWGITICRIIQGISSMGELIGAQLYLTEITRPPVQYPIVGIVAISSVIGSVCALFIANTVLNFGLEWRIAFWIGAMIALVGAMARTALRETPEFSDAKRRLKHVYDETETSDQKLKYNKIVNEKSSKKTLLYLFAMYCEWPICFYFVFIYCSNLLRNNFGYSIQDIIQHNLCLSLVQLLATSFVVFLSYKIHPLKIVKTRVIIFIMFILISPYLLNKVQTVPGLFIIQTLTLAFAAIITPACPIFFKHLPVFKRFTYSAFMYALSRALVYVMTSFGMVYLTKYFGNYGFLVIALPISIVCYFSICHFQNKEQKDENLLYDNLDCNVEAKVVF